MKSSQPFGAPHRRIFAAMFLIALAVLFLGGCGHHKTTRVSAPPPPPPVPSPQPELPQPSAKVPSTKVKPSEPEPESDADLAEPAISADAKVLATETGLASWYGPPYHNRRASNGEIYNMYAMTAAHRTYALGSIVRVTNVKTGSSALVRITDRGPFIHGRVIDLSLAAAKKIDVWRPGIAEVKVELMQSATLKSTGKWAVQIGGFSDENSAAKLADHLTRRYHTAKVLRFSSPAGDWWIRVRVLNDDHERAQKLAADTTTPEGSVFLVRLD